VLACPEMHARNNPDRGQPDLPELRFALELLTSMQSRISEMRGDLGQSRSALDLLRASPSLPAEVQASVERAVRCLAKTSRHLDDMQRLFAAAVHARVVSATPNDDLADPPIRAARPQCPGDAISLNPCLTRRETEVAVLLGRGLTNKQIGDELVISTATARVHVEHIMAKLNVHSRGQVAFWAIQHEPLLRD
jgi:DNA-binding NarL/FixJ family response regulator